MQAIEEPRGAFGAGFPATGRRWGQAGRPLGGGSVGSPPGWEGLRPRCTRQGCGVRCAARLPIPLLVTAPPLPWEKPPSVHVDFGGLSVTGPHSHPNAEWSGHAGQAGPGSALPLRKLGWAQQQACHRSGQSDSTSRLDPISERGSFLSIPANT